MHGMLKNCALHKKYFKSATDVENSDQDFLKNEFPSSTGRSNSCTE